MEKARAQTEVVGRDLSNEAIGRVAVLRARLILVKAMGVKNYSKSR